MGFTSIWDKYFMQWLHVMRNAKFIIFLQQILSDGLLLVDYFFCPLLIINNNLLFKNLL